MKSLLTVMALALLCANPRIARAEDKAAARQAYDEGRRRYDLNEFGSALEAFKRAYLNYEDPVFLFNLAQCPSSCWPVRFAYDPSAKAASARTDQSLSFCNIFNAAST